MAVLSETRVGNNQSKLFSPMPSKKRNDYPKELSGDRAKRFEHRGSDAKRVCFRRDTTSIAELSSSRLLSILWPFDYCFGMRR